MASESRCEPVKILDVVLELMAAAYNSGVSQGQRRREAAPWREMRMMAENKAHTVLVGAGYRYIPTPDQLAALTTAARAVLDHLEYEASQRGGDYGETVGPLAYALEAALEPFAKDPADANT